MPSLFIRTESGSLDALHKDKSYKEPGTLTAAENGKVTLRNEPLKQIKGRGNSTWYKEQNKKPYNIKFQEAKSFLGMDKAKKWTLLANALDDSLLRNAVSLTLAKWLNISCATDFRYADLYINGDYRGNYLICESVEIGDGRVQITDLSEQNKNTNPNVEADDLPLESKTSADPGAVRFKRYSPFSRDPEDISGGYLLEFEQFPDRFSEEPAVFISAGRQQVVIKEPEYCSEKEVDFISGYYQEMEDAVFSATGVNEKGRSFTEYIDQPSFINMFLLQELTLNTDFMNSSNFIFKDAGDNRFHAGPAWDFDLALPASDSEAELKETDYWIVYGGVNSDAIIDRQPSFYQALLQKETVFCDAAARWKTFSYEHTAEIRTLVNDTAESILRSAVMDNLRWMRSETADPETAEQLFKEAVHAVQSTLTHRLSALDNGFCAPQSMRNIVYLLQKNGLLSENTATPTWPNSEETATVSEPAGNTNTPRIYLTAALCGVLLLIGFTSIANLKSCNKNKKTE